MPSLLGSRCGSASRQSAQVQPKQRSKLRSTRASAYKALVVPSLLGRVCGSAAEVKCTSRATAAEQAPLPKPGIGPLTPRRADGRPVVCMRDRRQGTDSGARANSRERIRSSTPALPAHGTGHSGQPCAALSGPSPTALSGTIVRGGSLALEPADVTPRDVTLPSLPPRRGPATRLSRLFGGSRTRDRVVSSDLLYLAELRLGLATLVVRDGIEPSLSCDRSTFELADPGPLAPR